MSADLGDLTAKLRIDTSALGDALGAVQGFGADLSGVLGGVGLSPVVAGFAGLAAAATLTVTTFTSFQDASAALQTSMGITADQTKAIGDAFLSTAGTATFAADDMLKAFAPVAGQLDFLNGGALSASQSLDFMNHSMDLATATGSDLNTATAALAKVMVAFNIPLKDAANSTDLLYNTARITGIPIDTLAMSLTNLHLKLGIAGPSLQDDAILLGLLASSGFSGDRALRLLSSAMSTLLSGSKPVTAELAKLHINAFDANGNFIGMTALLPQLAGALATMSPEARLAAEQILFGKGSAEAMNAVLSKTPTTLAPATKAVEKHGTTAAAAGVRTDTFTGALSRLGAYVKDHLTQILDDATHNVETNWGAFFDHSFGAWAQWGQNLAGLVTGIAHNIQSTLSAIFGTNMLPPGSTPADARAAVAAWAAAHGGPAPPPGWGRAAGGPVLAGMTHLVGERGPELFTPSVSGYITPNNQLGGSPISNTFYISALPEAIVAQVQQVVSQNNAEMVRLTAAGRRG